MNRELILEYAAKTEHLGVPESWEATGRAAEPNCGDELVYYLSTKRDVVTEISYTITESACPPAKACAARAAEAVLGKPVMEAYLLDAWGLSEFFGGLEKESIHCAMMAALALKTALRNYAETRRSVRNT